MWWKKQIEDHSALILMRVAVAVMYVFIALYLFLSSEGNIFIIHGSKVISNFCLFLSVTILLPVVESIYKEDDKRFVNMLSNVFAFFIILIMHVYLFNSFGISQTYGFIAGSFFLNIAAQLPLCFLSNKVYAKNS